MPEDEPHPVERCQFNPKTQTALQVPIDALTGEVKMDLKTTFPVTRQIGSLAEPPDFRTVPLHERALLQ